MLSFSKAADVILKLPADGNIELDPSYSAAYETLSADPGVQDAMARGAELQLNDSTSYFWERAGDILRSDFVPNEQDILRARVRTTGIVQQNFAIDGRRYTMFDVGGQRNERRKWIHVFDGVTAIIFVTALSEFDQVLFEDETINRMDEALLLFEQILGHKSFRNTSIILFLNKRDLFEEKLKRGVPLTAWDKDYSGGNDYHTALDHVKARFLALNKRPEQRQIYAHATCATDTDNVQFVMASVFDIILKENLRKMDEMTADALSNPGGGGGGSGKSAIKSPAPYSDGTVLLMACYFTDSLNERKVLVDVADLAKLPAVEVQRGGVTDSEWLWCMGLGKALPSSTQLQTAHSELGTFAGNFKDAVRELRQLIGLGPAGDLGSLYDRPVYLDKTKLTLILCLRKLPKAEALPGAPKMSMEWRVHEEFEDATYLKYSGRDTAAAPCKPPPKDKEFNPFAANPVRFRWFKGAVLFNSQVEKIPQRGVYLGILRVVSTTSGFKVMVNEHNRVMIPHIFLTSHQLTEEERTWMHGVRVRWERGTPLLEGATPNRGWLGPEVTGEDGATFREKLWWAIGEAKERLGLPESKPGASNEAEGLGVFYDYEAIDIDEKNRIQLLLFCDLVEDETELQPGHVWVDRKTLEVQNMRYMCPLTLASITARQGALQRELAAIDTGVTVDNVEVMKQMRKQKQNLKANIAALSEGQKPLRWVNRVITWCADKRPSFADGVPGKEALSTDELVAEAMRHNTTVRETKAEQRGAAQARAPARPFTLPVVNRRHASHFCSRTCPSGPSREQRAAGERERAQQFVGCCPF